MATCLVASGRSSRENRGNERETRCNNEREKENVPSRRETRDNAAEWRTANSAHARTMCVAARGARHAAAVPPVVMK